MDKKTQPTSTPSSPGAARGVSRLLPATSPQKATAPELHEATSPNRSDDGGHPQKPQQHPQPSPLPSLTTSPGTNFSFSPQTPASSTSSSRHGSFALSDDSPCPPPNFAQLVTSPAASPTQLIQHEKGLSKAASNSTIHPSATPIPGLNAGGQLDPDGSSLAQPGVAAPVTATAEIASAEMAIAADGSFVETTSAHAARELKRVFDQQLGVGKAGVRSPYAIVVAEDAEGRKVYRVSSRPAPAFPSDTANAATATDSTIGRRIRLSVGGFLPPNLFKPQGPNQVATISAASQHNKASGSKKPAKLLRTTRSSSELRSPTGNIPGASRLPKSSVTSGHSTDDSSYGARVPTELLTTNLDVFGMLMKWSSEKDSRSASSQYSSDLSASWASSSEEDFPYAAFTRKDKKTGLRPFGDGVSYTLPSRPLDLSIRPPRVRLMQSFESGLTARADDNDRSTPTEAMARPHATLSPTHGSASPYGTEIFEILQNYRGIPLANTLSAVSTEKTFKLSSTVSAVPKDDPRFVIWGEVQRNAEPDDESYAASQSDLSSMVSSRRKGDKLRRGSILTESSHSTGNGVAGLPLGQKVIVAATIERWIAQLTSELNYVELLDFFLTYRVYIRSIDLCQLFICRFHWAIENSKTADDEFVKRIVRVRTFIAFRYWLRKFFQVDFLPNRELCTLLTGWLNSLKADEGIVGSGKHADVLDIVRKLKKEVRECKANWSRHSTSSVTSTVGSGTSPAPKSSSETADRGGPGASRAPLGTEIDDSDVDLDLGDASRGATSGLDVSIDLNDGIADDTATLVSTPITAVGSPISRVSTRARSTSLSLVRKSDVSTAVSTMSGGSGSYSFQTIQSPPAPRASMVGGSSMIVNGNGPMQHSAISRAFVNTMGRLGRWKRVLHLKSSSASQAGHPPGGPPTGLPNQHPTSGLGMGCADVSAFDLDLQDAVFSENLTRGASATVSPLHGGVGGGVVAVRGGVDQFLRSREGMFSGDRHAAGLGTRSPRPSVDYPTEYRSTTTHQQDTTIRADSPTGSSHDAILQTAALISGSSQTPPADRDGNSSPLSPPGLDIPSHLLDPDLEDLTIMGLGSSGSRPVHEEETEGIIPTETQSSPPPQQGDRVEGSSSLFADEMTPVGDIPQEPDAAHTLPPGESELEGLPSTDKASDKLNAGLQDEEPFAVPEEIKLFVNGLPNVAGADSRLSRTTLAGDNFDALVAPSPPPHALKFNPQAGRTKRLTPRDDASDVMTASEDADTSSQADDADFEDERYDPRNQRPEIVSLDDFDLSDSASDSDGDDNARNLRPARRLPTRRDFEFVRRSKETVSSLGIRSMDAHSSIASSSAMSESSDTGPAAPELGEIKDWQVAMITESDEEEPGDVEAALRRLEGQIDANLQRAKARKVDKWMKAVEKRLAMGGTIDFSNLDEEEDESTSDSEDHVPPTESPSADPEMIESPAAIDQAPPLEEDPAASVDVEELQIIVEADQDESGIPVGDYPVSHEEREALGGTTPTPDLQTSSMPTPPVFAAAAIPLPPDTPTSSAEASTTTSAFVASAPRTDRRRAATTSLTGRAEYLKRLSGPPQRQPVIRGSQFAWLFTHRSEAVAQQLGIIERELFLAVKFGEVVSGVWMRHEHQEVLDWVQYLKEKAKLKVEARNRREEAQFSDISALRARFNLLVGFVASCIVLVHPHERAAAICKVIRIAWKAYMHNNYSLVVTLITALQTAPVKLATRKAWSKVDSWELRVYEDLQEFANPRENFKMVRRSTAALTDSRPVNSDPTGPTPIATSSTPSVGKGKAPDNKSGFGKGCIPFFGVYLHELEQYAKLPEYVDPTSPASPVGIDKDTGSLNPPSHPEVFSTLAALPASIPLEPLINVHKQRLTARVVQSIVAGQHLASSVSFEMDRKLYHKCLRLHTLDAETLLQTAANPWVDY